jgi:hypothetical protein
MLVWSRNLMWLVLLKAFEICSLFQKKERNIYIYALVGFVTPKIPCVFLTKLCSF